MRYRRRRRKTRTRNFLLLRAENVARLVIDVLEELALREMSQDRLLLPHVTDQTRHSGADEFPSLASRPRGDSTN